MIKVKLEIESMQAVIVKAFSEHCEELSAQAKIEVEKVMRDTNWTMLFNDAIRDATKQVVEQIKSNLTNDLCYDYEFRRQIRDKMKEAVDIPFDDRI